MTKIIFENTIWIKEFQIKVYLTPNLLGNEDTARIKSQPFLNKYFYYSTIQGNINQLLLARR